IEGLLNTGKGARGYCQQLAVDFQQALVQPIKARRIEFQVEGHAHQSTRAVGNRCADSFVRQCVQAFFLAQLVDGGVEVRRGVEQGTVQIENYSFKHRREVSSLQSPVSSRQSLVPSPESLVPSP